ncbi:transcriptional regulator, TetR family [Streptomyces sp. Ncost-T6T-1]|uniref:TetR/AcrR family transcriptional regulator n=1 Tax=Streptomyces sp. Ncost-T6T-1 TaxID=1100828 RepID=UPI000805BD2C|nr:TetR/AcrR family transcriptional regulator [Streptomyces sp. Ncost-T6T-1]SBV01572.1 transcriptional regulator, TetR family [Streptomyces sp. Ncost-T6T-1]
MPKVPSSQLVLDAAYRCFCRNGYRRTTVSDIVEEAQMSRPTVYKYVGSKEEAIVKVVRSRLEQAGAASAAAADAADTPQEKVLAVLTVKLDVAIRLWQDSPAHAQELLSAATAQAPDLVTAYTDGLAVLLTAALAEVVPDSARQAAAVLLTFTRGLEDDLRDADAVRDELAIGVHMITRGALDRPASTPTCPPRSGPAERRLS